jgi:hypothetical protein
MGGIDKLTEIEIFKQNKESYTSKEKLSIIRNLKKSIKENVKEKHVFDVFNVINSI